MTILVTGGAGYIGSHTVLALRDAGENVIVLDDLSTGTPDAIPEGVPLVTGDVADASVLQRIFSQDAIEAIVHFAAKIVVPDSIRDPLGYYASNTVKTRALVEAAVAANVPRFIFSSTAAVYGEPSSSFVDEKTPTAPINPYGRSKLMSEWMLADAAAAHGLRYVALRYFNVAGADPAGRLGQSTPGATHLIKVACQAALGQRDSLNVFGIDYPTADGTGVRDYIQVSDLADAHVAALGHLRGGGDSLVLNCGYGRGSSVLDVVRAIRAVSGLEVPLQLAPRRAGDPAALIARADRIRADLKWRPRHDDLNTIVAQALAWERTLASRAVADRSESQELKVA
ncbi:MAG: UDP-glucose 4-epimerase GalE [Mesorhizobium sp.]|nr:UDP-glucose 4-epimerase GalE [Mesorhizobium sp.]